MTTITVTSLSDNANTSRLTLREAVAMASAGDTIVFSSRLTPTGVTLHGNLDIAANITIDGSQGHGAGLGGLYINSARGSLVVDAGADVTLSHLQVIGGAAGHAGLHKGKDGTPGTLGTSGGAHGGDGSDGGNGGDSHSPGFIGSPALINQGHLTLDHASVSGSSAGGTGRVGGAGGSGGAGGQGSIDAGNGGNGGDGGNGSNGATAVGGILNEGALVLRDSAIRFCLANGGDGGAGGAGGAGGKGGQGGPGGTGGAGGNGGDGGSGGAAVAGILNQGSVTIEGAALMYGNTATGGAGGAAGAAGAGGLGGNTGTGLYNGQVGTDGSSGASGSTGSGVIYDGAGPSGGSFVSGSFFEIGGPGVVATTISSVASGGTSFRGVFASALREGQLDPTDTVAWHISGGGLTAGDFVGGVLPGGTLTFSSGANSNHASFTFASTFSFTGSLTFQVTLSSPSTDTALGFHTTFTETIFAATAKADSLTGTIGNDSLDGGKGNDHLNGGDGSDNLLGNLGNDVIRGGTGDDQLTGGAGRDALFGGAGADTFFFFTGDSTASAPDLIGDFSHRAGDKISFGFLAHSFIGSAAFDGTAGEVRFTSGGGQTHVFFDANGDKVADSAVTLTGLHTMVASDFGL